MSIPADAAHAADPAQPAKPRPRRSADGRRRANARKLTARLLDPGSFQSWDEPVDISPHPAAYRAELEAAARQCGADEAVLTGRGLARGRPLAVVVSEFGFLGGSVGRAAAARITSAVRRATAERLPLLASTASGGTRLQEGTPAFVQMVTISRALMDHRAAGLPYLVHLRDPTTGGVYASWGSLGHLTLAEPGALIAFLGPKVSEGLRGRPFPPGVQVAENLAARGVIDGVVRDDELPSVIDNALAVLTDPPARGVLRRRQGVLRADPSAWAAVEATRRHDRAGVRDLLRHGGAHTVWLGGTEQGMRDATMIAALTRIDGEPCVLTGQDRTRQTPQRATGPTDLRAAQRAMGIAEELGLPLVTVIDTPGGALSPAAEEGALAGEIARCLGRLAMLTVPTVAVLLGQGCGGPALALLPARRVIAAERAWLAPLAPEGAAIILHGDPSRAAEVAEGAHARAVDLLAGGTVQHVVPEPDDDTPDALARALAAEIADSIRGFR